MTEKTGKNSPKDERNTRPIWNYQNVPRYFFIVTQFAKLQINSDNSRKHRPKSHSTPPKPIRKHDT